MSIHQNAYEKAKLISRNAQNITFPEARFELLFQTESFVLFSG